MDDRRLGAALRALRLRRSLRQVDVAGLAGVSDVAVSRVERGELDGLSLRAIRRIAGALDVRVELLGRSRGAELDRIVNGRHAALAEHVISALRRRPAWTARPELSFAIYGERGVIDILAWHAGARAVLVVELKTAIIDVGEILGTLDRKRRLAPRVAAELGWQPVAIGTWLAVGESMTSRRRLAEHGLTFAAALPDDSRRLRRWLETPAGELRALSLVTDRRQTGPRSRFATLQRAPAAHRSTRHAQPKGPSVAEAASRAPTRPDRAIKPPLQDDL